MASRSSDTLDVTQFMQDLRFSRYHLTILVLCSLVTFFDGQDFAALAYALPYIRDDMGISDEMTGYVSSAAFLGQMIGSLFGSYLGDIFGRRPVIIACTCGSALMTMAVGFADTAEHLIALRFVSGLAIGGLLAPVWALSIESMPKSMRATSVTIIMMGFSVGTASSGPIANWIAPVWGWQGIFWVCGVLTGIFAILLAFTLHESARWMVATNKPPARIIPILSRFNPGYEMVGYERFILSDERQTTTKNHPVAKLRELFAGALAIVTPLIWAAYFFSSFSIYLKSAYGVIFMENLGIARQNAAWLGSASALLGAFGGVALLAMTERRGPGWIALAPLLAVPIVVLIGTGAVIGGDWFVPSLLVSAILVGAGHSAVISITSVYYPSAVRATGGGWASFMAKFAAVAAPIFGAQFLSGSSGAMAGYMFTAYCLVGIVVCILLLGFFARKLTRA
ncbi:MFS transporter [Altererythrobacter sp. B11]|uniref:MFS transporter n=1 Tax=Altererythrobacter sp. B11 TaxID=2060312 RepID=UPI000DC6FA9D|nr:MFS transporter [Altererythrobacter sp. B11]BBC74371.1 MFS transporter [Altererythrobacter sp. B11]